MLSREISAIGMTCTAVLGTWMAFAIFMFGWDVSDLEALVTPRKPPVQALAMRRSFQDFPQDAGRPTDR